MPTAVVIDGAFFSRRFANAFPKLDARSAAGILCMIAFRFAAKPQASHGWLSRVTDAFHPEGTSDPCRIFFYDRPPLTKRVHTPIDAHAASDLL